jgi:hypothetical protein
MDNGQSRDTGNNGHNASNENKTKQETQHRRKDEQHGPHQKARGEPRYLRKVSISCYLYDTHRVTRMVKILKVLMCALSYKAIYSIAKSLA